VLLILKCVFILIMVYFLNLFETKYETQSTEVVETVHYYKYYIVKNVVLFYNSVFPM